ncbi:MAG: hypothetical protein RRC34_12700 [Lentisphaeria bacterium]|nr:hypothetical protein [Lentisphaeria bacterium]
MNIAETAKRATHVLKSPHKRKRPIPVVMPGLVDILSACQNAGLIHSCPPRAHEFITFSQQIGKKPWFSPLEWQPNGAWMDTMLVPEHSLVKTV